MTNDLTTLRQRIVDHLTAKGFDTFPVMPESAPIPCVWTTPGDPYLSHEGAGFGALIVRHQVNFAAAAGMNDVAAEELDAMALRVLDALDEMDEVVTGDVDRIGLAAINGQQYLAGTVNVFTEIHRS